MIEQRAVVTRVMASEVEVEVELQSSCSGCHSADNCGVGTVAKAFTAKTQRLNIATNLILNPGQQVTIATAESGVLTLAALTYLLPLFGLLFFAVIAQQVLVNSSGLAEWWAIAMALSGGYIFHHLAKKIIQSKVKAQQVIIVSADLYH